MSFADWTWPFLLAAAWAHDNAMPGIAPQYVLWETLRLVGFWFFTGIGVGLIVVGVRGER